jgi:hypothetical protein
MPEPKRTAKKRPQRNVQALMVEDALSTWLLPTIGAVLLGGAMLLDALGLIAEPPAALLAVIALLILGVFAAVGPVLGESDERRPQPLILLGAALAWIVVFVTPFVLRLYPGRPLQLPRSSHSTPAKLFRSAMVASISYSMRTCPWRPNDRTVSSTMR